MTFVTLLTCGIPHHHFQLDVLKCELVVHQAEQFERTRIGHVPATQFDPRRFTGEFRMRFRDFAVEQK